MRKSFLFASLLAFIFPAPFAQAQNPTPDVQLRALLDSVHASPLAALPHDVPTTSALSDPNSCGAEIYKGRNGQRLVLFEGCLAKDSTGIRILLRLYDVRVGRQPALLGVITGNSSGQGHIRECRVWFNKGIYYGVVPTSEFESRDSTVGCLANNVPLELITITKKLAELP